MASLHVQFSDVSQETVVRYFAGAQDTNTYSHLGALDTADERWRAFYESVGGEMIGLPPPTIAAS